MTRTAFFVDGFNLYHSLLAASRAMGGASTRWLDLRALCGSLLYRIGGGAQATRVAYFTALAHHLGHFKRAEARCPHCTRRVARHEEKETDVAIGVSLLECFVRDTCDVAVLVTGDSDQAPAVRKTLELFPQRRVFVCFPFDRVSDELRQVASGHFGLGASQYSAHQFPDPVVGRNGRWIRKPEPW